MHGIFYNMIPLYQNIFSFLILKKLRRKASHHLQNNNYNKCREYVLIYKTSIIQFFLPNRMYCLALCLYGFFNLKYDETHGQFTLLRIKGRGRDWKSKERLIKEKHANSILERICTWKDDKVKQGQLFIREAVNHLIHCKTGVQNVGSDIWSNWNHSISSPCGNLNHRTTNLFSNALRKLPYQTRCQCIFWRISAM